jgi:DHA1 family tetracycline resistance protein-like MFS transporter
MNACFGLGFVAGPLLGGLAGTLSPRYPFLLAAISNGLNLMLGYFVLPESRPPRANQAEETSFSPFDSLRWAWGMKVLLPLLAIAFVVELVGQVGGTIWVIYGEDRFGWDARMVGVSLAAFGILHAAAQAFLTGPTTRLLGERGSIVLGLLVDGAGYVLMAFATEGWMVFAIMPLLTAGGVAMPALQSLLSKLVDEEKQGELQGILTSLMSLTAIVGPVAVSGLYAASYDSWKGAVWAAGAALYALCVPALWRMPRPTRHR